MGGEAGWYPEVPGMGDEGGEGTGEGSGERNKLNSSSELRCLSSLALSAFCFFLDVLFSFFL